MSSIIANFASGIGVYDASLVNNPSLDASANVGIGDLSLNTVQAQYMMSNTNFTTPTATVGNGISFSGWFYPVGTQSNGSTIFDISGTGVACALYYYNSSNQLAGYFNGISVQSNVTVTPGQWHFFTYTIYCTSLGYALQSLYIDNSYNATNSYAATNSSASYTSFSVGSSISGTKSYIGYGKGGGSVPSFTYFNGKIDDFRFYNRVLSLPEINVLYNFNYKSGAIPSIVATLNYDISYVNAVQIDVSGIFSGLYVTRTAQSGGSTVTTTSTISCANLVFVNATTWAYVDTTVAADTSYSYSVTPYVMNTSGAISNLGSITTTPLYNGFFNQGTGLPTSGNYVAATSSKLPGWTFASGGQIFVCNGSVTNIYTGTLPSSVTYYLDISQNTVAVTTIQQYVGIFQGTQGFVSFFAWPKDSQYLTTETLTVTLGGCTLLNGHSFTAPLATANPYTSFNLPFTMTTAGMYLLTFSITNATMNTSGINLGGIQIRSQSVAGIGYKCIDPFALALYYPFDSNTVSGTVVYDCSAGFTGAAASADASLNGGAAISTIPAPLIGSADVCFNGVSSYVSMGSWSMPPRVAGNGFSICGWFYPSGTTPVNSLLYWFRNTTVSSSMIGYLNTGAIDFSYNMTSGATGGVELLTSTVGYSYTPNVWNFFALTAVVGSDLSGTYTYYLNDVSLATLRGGWPNTSVVSSQVYNSNYLGGFPPGGTIAMNSNGNLGYLLGAMDDFRVYNRSLSSQDVLALWSYGFANSNSFMNLVDPNGLNIYYPMDQATDITKSPPLAFGVFTITGVTVVGFTMSFTGATGINVSYTFTVNGISVTPTGSYASGFTFSGLKTASASSLPTPYVWTVVVTASNGGGSLSSTQAVFIPPTVIGVYSGSTVSLTLSNGLNSGNGVTWGYTIGGSGTSGYSSFTDLATAVAAQSVSGSSVTVVITQSDTSPIISVSSSLTLTSNVFIPYSPKSITGCSLWLDAADAATITTLSPLSVSGCNLWLDAADTKTITQQTSGYVSQWNDKSGKGYNFSQATFANQPTYVTNSQNGNPTIRFTSTLSQFLGGGTTFDIGTNSWTIFAVFKTDDNTSGASIFNKSLYGSGQNRLIIVRNSGSSFQCGVTETKYLANPETFTAGAYRMFCYSYARRAGNAYLYQNGTQITSGSPGIDTTTNVTNSYPMIIGGYNDSSGNINTPTDGLFLMGNICEIVSYSQTADMTTADRQTIEGYLAWKWGLQTSGSKKKCDNCH